MSTTRTIKKKFELKRCQNCGDARSYIRYCSECNEELCADCWSEEGHNEHQDEA